MFTYAAASPMGPFCSPRHLSYTTGRAEELAVRHSKEGISVKCTVGVHRRTMAWDENM